VICTSSSGVIPSLRSISIGISVYGWSISHWTLLSTLSPQKHFYSSDDDSSLEESLDDDDSFEEDAEEDEDDGN